MKLAHIKGMPKLLSQLRACPKLIEKTATELVRKNARTLISSSGKVPGLVQVTPPHGGLGGGARGKEARQMGEGAVARDITTVYASPAALYSLIKAYAGEKEAGYFWRLHKNNYETRLRRYLDLEAPPAVRMLARGWDGGKAHQERRNAKGRVSGGKPSVMLLDAADLRQMEAHIRRKKKHVGMLAASVVLAYNGRYGQLAGVPAWVKRHAKAWAPGSVTERTTRNGLVVRISVDAGTLNKELRARFPYVLNYRRKAMEREAPYALRAAARAAGLLQ